MTFWKRMEKSSLNILLIAMIMLLLLGFARIYTVTKDLKAEQAAACALRRAGRANTNTHERVPLAAAFNYLGTLAIASASKQASPARKAATIEFGHRFEAYARLIQPLPNPNC